MTQIKIALTENEIQEQHGYSEKYLGLIEKELGYGDLVNVENVTRYTECYKNAQKLIQDPFVYITDTTGVLA